jgi:hypothetical protein
MINQDISKDPFVKGLFSRMPKDEQTLSAEVCSWH